MSINRLTNEIIFQNWIYRLQFITMNESELVRIQNKGFPFFIAIRNFIAKRHFSVADYYDYCGEMCSSIVENEGDREISGKGLTVEADEVRFGRLKYHRGRDQVLADSNTTGVETRFWQTQVPQG